MREIKFRAWDNVDKKMESVYFLNWRYPSGLEVNNTNVCLPNNLMQYTGLKDKNGKEIYEGDIVNITPYGDKSSVYKMEIKYSEEYADYSISYKLEECWFEIKDLEVIGNIYENPELLGDKK